MHISDYFHTTQGHKNFDFVDINTLKDTILFIDPCLIEANDDTFCRNAKSVMQDYFDIFYRLYRDHSANEEKLNLFTHSHEINATKLGYGSGTNGKAKTATGMADTFSGLQQLIDSNIPISHAIDLPIFISNFAEDCLSDMLTNILFEVLNSFTVEQCEKYGIETLKLPENNYYWDKSKHIWSKFNGNGLIIDREIILLVPKNIVRKSYYYNIEQYFRSMILTKIQDDNTVVDSNGNIMKPSKKDLRENLLKSHGDILDISIEKTTELPNHLEVYHNRMINAYTERGLSDTALDERVYKNI